MNTDKQLKDLLCASQAHDKIHLHCQVAAAWPFIVAQCYRLTQAPMLVITPDNSTAEQILDGLRFFLDAQSSDVQAFPDWELLPYDPFSTHQDIVSSRLKTLTRLIQGYQGITVLAVDTLMQRVCPVEFVEQHCFSVALGEKLCPMSLCQQLQERGYERTHQVTQHGEYTQHGAMVDLYPMGLDNPLRLEFFDQEVDSIRTFDPQTQLTICKVNSAQCLPAREHPADPAAWRRFRTHWQQKFGPKVEKHTLYQRLSETSLPVGLEYYHPLFFEEGLVSLLDYFSQETMILQVGNISAAAEQFWEQFNARFEEYRYDVTRPLLPPHDLCLPPADLFKGMKAHRQVLIKETPGSSSAWHFDYQPLPDISLNHHHQHPEQRLLNFLDTFSGQTLIFTAESKAREELLAHWLQKWGLHHRHCAYELKVAPLHRGFYSQSEGLAVIPEPELTGIRHTSQASKTKTATQSLEQSVKNLTELKINDAIIHTEHGIGRYRGLKTLDSGGIEADYLVLDYAGGDTLYVPIASLELISRAGQEHLHTLDKLGSDRWRKTKQKALKEMKDVAAELLTLYAKRSLEQGRSYPIDTLSYQAFCDAFPYEETNDQLTAIAAVEKDLTSTQPMDRVICGDVGFGKTEVAMRAAYIVASQGAQVVVLVPTTLLAEQHFRTFSDRFSGTPVEVGLLSRFVGSQAQKELLKKTAAGAIDVLIATHKLFSSSCTFKNLGLVVVDEEHRFGVRQKEKLKAWKANTDYLSLTATPIPRTLNMAMGGMRDISIIGTSPARRLSIHTFVSEENVQVIKEACLREIHRGGQVYYLHNDVQTMAARKEYLQKLLPQASIEIAHGQMRERDLENVMQRFYRGQFQILLCSTIIETGIDIPSANTILIDRADKFGLAQLHQLRGRVGRSHHQAYAFLFVPHASALRSDAKLRLDAIAQHQELGVGFQLAMHDLEIRGAGELLGHGQSGNIQAIGYQLYMEMLNKTIHHLKHQEPLPMTFEMVDLVDVNLHVTVMIPEDYMPDVHTRLVQYKRLSDCKTPLELQALKDEMLDRFGHFPSALDDLFKVSHLKLLAQSKDIQKIELRSNGGRVQFKQPIRWDMTQMIQRVQKNPQHYRLTQHGDLTINKPLLSAQERFTEAEQILATIKMQACTSTLSEPTS